MSIIGFIYFIMLAAYIVGTFKGSIYTVKETTLSKLILLSFENGSSLIYQTIKNIHI